MWLLLLLKNAIMHSSLVGCASYCLDVILLELSKKKKDHPAIPEYIRIHPNRASESDI